MVSRSGTIVCRSVFLNEVLGKTGEYSNGEIVRMEITDKAAQTLQGSKIQALSKN
jgi:hypothetical protein